MDREHLIDFLKNSELFIAFKNQELESILPYFQIIFVEAGEYIVREGDTGINMYALISGKGEIFKEDVEMKKTHVIGTLGPGEWVGEMASIEKAKRSASIRAVEKSEVLVFLLDKLEFTEETFAKIQATLVRKVSQRLRKADEKIAVSLSENVKILQASNVLGRTIIHIFVLIAVWFNLALVLRATSKANSGIDSLFTAGMLVVFGISMAIIIKDSGYSPAFFGLTLQKWGRHALQGVIYSLPILGILTALKWFLVSHIPKFQHIPVFSPWPVDQTVSQAIVFGIIYILAIPVQEFIIRGGIQTCFRNFFTGPNRVYLAILTSNLLFELLHTVKNLWLALGTFALGFFWGALFEQQKSLVGVIVSHILIGIWVFVAINFQPIFNMIIGF
jgi:CRP-like cAMP-binding protein